MPRSRPRILVFAGSIRSGSYSAQLAAAVAKTLALRDCGVSLISLADYALPIYDGDLEAESGVPEAAKALHQQFLAHQGLFIATPEYNSSLPPLLKNAIDWVSRVKGGPRDPSPWKGRVFSVGASSPGAFGGMRALMHLRQVLEVGLGCLVLPEQVVLPSAAQGFAADGSVAGERTQAQVEALAGRLVEEAGRYA